MKVVRLQELEDHLAEHLREVQEGETLTVLDSETPIARIVPTTPEAEIHVRPPRPGAPALHEVALPPPLDLDLDIVDVLREERQRGR